MPELVSFLFSFNKAIKNSDPTVYFIIQICLLNSGYCIISHTKNFRVQTNILQFITILAKNKNSCSKLKFCIKHFKYASQQCYLFQMTLLQILQT